MSAKIYPIIKCKHCNNFTGPADIPEGAPDTNWVVQASGWVIDGVCPDCLKYVYPNLHELIGDVNE